MSEITTDQEVYTLTPDLAIPEALLQQAFESLMSSEETSDKERDQYLKAFAALSDGYTIGADGALRLQGSSGVYRIDGSFCYRTSVAKKNGKHGDIACKGFLRSGGNCYHIFAYRIVLAAQQQLGELT